MRNVRLASAFIVLAQMTPAQAQYKQIDLGTLGGSDSFPWRINDPGQVVGQSTTADGRTHAFLWEKGRMTDLGTLGGDNSVAYGISPLGRIVGTAQTASGVYHAVIWWNDGTVTELGTLGGPDSVAYCMNSAGQVAGTADTADGAEQAFIWQNGTMTAIAYPWYGTECINERGQVTGFSYWSGFHGFLWENGVTIDLGSLGSGYSQPMTLNNLGQVVGRSWLADWTGHAFMWQDGIMTDLGTLPGGWYSIANAINDRGQVVGLSTAADGLWHAVLWERGTMRSIAVLEPSPGGDPSIGGFGASGQLAACCLSGHAMLLIPPDADVNDDGRVTCADLAIVRAAFGRRQGQAGFALRADVYVDGVIDVRDLSFVAQRLPAGTRCP
jgi:probable HAF family extracellular repeat protein